MLLLYLLITKQTHEHFDSSILLQFCDVPDQVNNTIIPYIIVLRVSIQI